MSSGEAVDGTAYNADKLWFSLEPDPIKVVASKERIKHESHSIQLVDQTSVSMAEISMSSTGPNESGILGDEKVPFTSIQDQNTQRDYDSKWYKLKSVDVGDDADNAGFDATGLLEKQVKNSAPAEGLSVLDVSGNAESHNPSRYVETEKRHATLSANSPIGLQLSGENHVNVDEARFASIQRPEPLGKALADTHIIRASKVPAEHWPSSTQSGNLHGKPLPTIDNWVDASDGGLQEQEYPARIPLSVFEGDFVTEPLYRQAVPSFAPGAEMMHQKDSMDHSGSTLDHVTTPVTTGTANSSKSSLDTPISKMLEPTYQSSVALLKELQKRKHNPSKMNDAARPVDPFVLAENAVKASDILSTRTEKSLKRASLVLKAIEEHKTPPNDLFDSSSSNVSHLQSTLQDGINSLSISTSTGTKDVVDSRSSGDSIDRLISRRIKKQQDSSFVSTKTVSDSGSSFSNFSGKLLPMKSTEQSSARSTEESSDAPTFGYSGSSDQGNAEANSLKEDNRSSQETSEIVSKEGMSSELMQLGDFDPPTGDDASARFQSQMDEFSPIHRVNQASGSTNFRASSRIRGSKSPSLKEGQHTADSDVVNFHRSLGAGTVTPLPAVASVSGDSGNQTNVSNFLFRGRGDLHRSENASKEESLRSLEVTKGSVQSVQLDASIANSEGRSTRSLEGPSSNARGIYDVRDSTGPGSSNRKRLIAGKQPVSNDKATRDPTILYVSESEQSFPSKKVKQRKQHDMSHDESYSNDSKNPVEFRTNESNSSMNSEFPILSIAEQTPKSDELNLSNESKHSDSGINEHQSSAKPCAGFGYASSSQRSSGSFSEQDKDGSLIRRNHADSVESSFVLDPKREGTEKSRIRPPLSRVTELNQLWERFKSNFDYEEGKGKHEMLEKIDALNKLLLSANRATTPRALSHHLNQPPSSRSSSCHNGPSVIDPQHNDCPLCGKRSAHESNERGAVFKRGPEADPPLLLHTWTQTTPLSSNTRLQSQQKDWKSGNKMLDANMPVEGSSSDKENLEVAKGASSNEISDMNKNGRTDPSPLSWNLVIKDESKRNVSRKSVAKKDLQPPGPPRKKKEPVFTAWFQSARSDASGGSVVPLSAVPNLAETYRDNKQVQRIVVEKPSVKETKSVVRVGLQEAFQFAKSDFIRRSKLRMESVKNAKTRVKKKNTRNLQERHLNEAVFTCGAKPCVSTVEHLFKPKKRHISKKEMFDQNKKIYEKLPEVVKRREEERRSVQYQRNRIMMKQFDKKLRERLLRHKKQ